MVKKGQNSVCVVIEWPITAKNSQSLSWYANKPTYLYLDNFTNFSRNRDSLACYIFCISVGVYVFPLANTNHQSWKRERESGFFSMYWQ